VERDCEPCSTWTACLGDRRSERITPSSVDRKVRYGFCRT